MADVRSLLRQQRETRRIKHQYATYSEAGKLLCTLCREQIKAESLWDPHLRSNGHKQRLESSTRSIASGLGEADESASKRKLDDLDVSPDRDEKQRRKRGKSDLADGASNGAGPDSVDNSANRLHSSGKEHTRTPPALLRRASTTPSQGVELQIPSRPATPAHRDSSSSTTPGGAPLVSTAPSSAAFATPQPRQQQSQHEPLFNAVPDERPILTTPPVDESEWAAFEADIAAASAPYSEGAVISAPAMSAEQAAAAADAADGALDGDQNSKRRAQADIDIEDEREEATRALEDEFDEMQELEARVRRLKEKREVLRKAVESHDQSGKNAPPQELVGKENGTRSSMSEEEDDFSDDEEDDWDGFRFKT